MTTRLFNPPNCVAVRNKFLGSRGVGVYLSPIGGGQDDIVYRNQRLYRQRSGRTTAIGVPVVFSGDYTPATDELLNDATLDTNKLVDGETTGSFPFTLPSGYEAEGADFWIDLRTHEGGLENQSLYRPRHIIVGVGEESDAVLGTAALIRVVKLDGGDARIDFEYIASLSGAQPASFTLRKLTGTGTIADISVAFVSGQRDYSGTITGMTSGLTYTFRLFGVVGAVETQLIATITVVADGDGPAALTVTYSEET